MNTKNKNEKPKTKVGTINFSLILFSIAFSIIFLKKIFFFLDSFDEQITKSLQKMFNESMIDKIIKISKIINNNITYSMIIMIVDNFSNIFISFILSIILFFGNYISSILKLIFIEENVFIKNTNIKIFYCSFGYGLPSSEILILVSFIFSLLKFMKLNEKSFNHLSKFFIYFFSFLILIFSCFSLIISGTYFFTQILFSFFFGWGIYNFIFGLNIDLQDGNSLYNLLNKDFQILIVNFILLLIFIFTFIIRLKREPKIFENVICNKEKMFNENNGFYILNEGSFLPIGIYFANIFLFISLKLLLIYVLNNNQNYFLLFNFSQKNIDLNASFSSLFISSVTKWNKTSKIKSFLRLFINFILCSLCFIPYFLIDWNYSIYHVFLIKIFLPNCFFYLCYFFFFKKLLLKLHLINYTLFAQIGDQYDNLVSE